MLMIWSPLAAAILATAAPVQTPAAAACDVNQNRYCTEIAAIAADPRVQRALQSIALNTPRATRDLIEINEIPAPPFMEQARAARYLEMLRESGADSVWIDGEGNAIGLRKGTRGSGPVVVLEGHLDTVFPEGTDVTVRMRGDTLFAPGIGDDSRGLVVVLEALRAIDEAELRTEADLLFIGTVGEEGLGDLRGVKYLFRDGATPIDAYIAVDGGSAAGASTAGIGSHRYRVTFKGPGGHSWGAFGTANPVHALGRAIALFDARADELTRSGPRTSYNVGRIGGGTSVNSIAFEAWAEIDMRSENDANLDAVDQALQETVRQALAEQNAIARRDEHLTVEVEMVGDRPSGVADIETPLLQRTLATISHFGATPSLGSGSTNSNIPFSLGVPAVTIGRGGQGGDSHALTEWWMDVDGHVAIQQAMMLVLAQGGFRS